MKRAFHVCNLGLYNSFVRLNRFWHDVEESYIPFGFTFTFLFNGFLVGKSVNLCVPTSLKATEIAKILTFQATLLSRPDNFLIQPRIFNHCHLPEYLIIECQRNNWEIIGSQTMWTNNNNFKDVPRSFQRLTLLIVQNHLGLEFCLFCFFVYRKMSIASKIKRVVEYSNILINLNEGFVWVNNTGFGRFDLIFLKSLVGILF